MDYEKAYKEEMEKVRSLLENANEISKLIDLREELDMKNCRNCIHCTDKGDHLACDYPSYCFQGNGKGDYDKVGYKPKK